MAFDTPGSNESYAPKVNNDAGKNVLSQQDGFPLSRIDTQTLDAIDQFGGLDLKNVQNNGANEVELTVPQSYNINAIVGGKEILVGNSLSFNKDTIFVKLTKPEQEEPGNSNGPLRLTCGYRDGSSMNFIIRKPPVEQSTQSPKTVVTAPAINNDQFNRQKQVQAPVFKQQTQPPVESSRVSQEIPDKIVPLDPRDPKNNQEMRLQRLHPNIRVGVNDLQGELGNSSVSSMNVKILMNKPVMMHVPGDLPIQIPGNCRIPSIRDQRLAGKLITYDNLKSLIK